MRPEVKQIKQFAKKLNYDPTEFENFGKYESVEASEKAWNEKILNSKYNYKLPTPVKIKKGTKWCAKSSSGSISGQIMCDANIVAIAPHWFDCIIFDVPCVKSNSKFSTPRISISPTYLSTDILEQICEQL